MWTGSINNISLLRDKIVVYSCYYGIDKLREYPVCLSAIFDVLFIIILLWGVWGEKARQSNVGNVCRFQTSHDVVKYYANHGCLRVGLYDASHEWSEFYIDGWWYGCLFYMREMNENINQLNKIIYMRRLLLLIFAFVSFVGINVGRAQSALPYEINFGDSQDGGSVDF